MIRVSTVRCLAAGPSTAQGAVPGLLGYSIRKAAASEMLYGGVRVQWLVQPAFPLHKIKSEELPSPSLGRERHDLDLEMHLPKDFQGYDNININIERQVGDTEVEAPTGAEGSADKGFDFGGYFTDAHHPERHHNSSQPYSARDTNNVLALRLFPVNMHIRLRMEGVRIRTEDCLERLRDSKLCQSRGVPVEYPLPLAARYAVRKPAVPSPSEETLYSGSIDPRTLVVEKVEVTQSQKEARRLAHLRGAGYHPHPSELSIVTRPADRVDYGSSVSAGKGYKSIPLGAVLFGNRSNAVSQMWTPLQMLKPIASNWSASMRSSGSRGPHMQLMQERLDQKGFGWKKKSRSLWQQDTATAGFRPHRYF